MSKAMITVKRYLLLVIGFCIAISVITPCELYPGDEETAEDQVKGSVKQPTAVFMITHWSQTYYGVPKYWGQVHITYLVINTSPYGIRYNVIFKVTCESGNVYTDSVKGVVGYIADESLTSTDIYTGGERATDVIIQSHSESEY